MAEDIHNIIAELDIQLIKYGVFVDSDKDGYFMPTDKRTKTVYRLLLDKLEWESKIELTNELINSGDSTMEELGFDLYVMALNLGSAIKRLDGYRV